MTTPKTPLDMYHSLGYIDPEHYEAGKALRDDWYLSGIKDEVKGNPKYKRGYFPEEMIEARQRYRRTMRALDFYEWQLIVAVVLQDYINADQEKKILLAAPHVCQRLQIALDKVGKEYRIEKVSVASTYAGDMSKKQKKIDTCEKECFTEWR